MAELVLYYSYNGHTRAEAERLAAERGAALCEIRDAKRPGKLKAYVAGCFAALRQRGWPIQPLAEDPAKYDHVVLLAPVWAGHPAPPFNSAVALLAPGTQADVVLVSAGGATEGVLRAKLEAKLQQQGCTLASLRDVKA